MASDVIKLLPDAVANQIAAGEVIQRPASVVKELVENAVDAGADVISIIIRDAGRTLIQVVDNGCGMSATDARMAFERHATSKITQAADLFALHTMGFRGEALPSIAAVAQIDMRTMRREDTMGTRLLISESNFEGQEPCACVPGTNLMVKNLFFHMPARRKFLKKDAVELSHIMHEFERLALVNTGVDFTVVHNDVTVHQMLRGSLKQRICSLFGRSMDAKLIEIGTEAAGVRISGFVTLPEYAVKRGAHQFFFVNGRNMRHPYFHKAVMTCYEKLIPTDAQPSYFINFEVDPSTIDVNIHPQKHEIKFEAEQMIWQMLIASVREGLGKVHALGGIDFDRDDAPEIPAYERRTDVAAPESDFDPNYNPFRSDPTPTAPTSTSTPGREFNADSSRRQSNLRNWDSLYDSFRRDAENAFDEFRQSGLNSEPEQSELPAMPQREVAACMQLQNRYLIAVAAPGLMLIDRHRAHVRVLYDRYMALLGNGTLASQQLLFPETVQLSPSQSAILSSVLPSLAQCGFDIEPMSPQVWAVNGLPEVVASSSPQALLAAIVDGEADGSAPAAEVVMHRICLAMSRSAAIRAGEPMTQADAEVLVAELTRAQQGAHTPDGLAVYTILSPERIAQLLG